MRRQILTSSPLGSRLFPSPRRRLEDYPAGSAYSIRWRNTESALITTRNPLEGNSSSHLPPQPPKQLSRYDAGYLRSPSTDNCMIATPEAVRNDSRFSAMSRHSANESAVHVAVISVRYQTLI